MSTPSVHLLGDLMVDLALHVSTLEAITRARGSDLPTRAVLSPGGSAANTATWLARCGLTVSLIGAVGTDPLGDYLINHIESSGVRVVVQRVPGELTGVCLILNENSGERTMIPSAGANAGFNDPLLHQQLTRSPVTHVHVSAYMLFHRTSGATALAYMESARRLGATISLDPASSKLLFSNRERLIAALSMTDLLLANVDEAHEITRLLSHDGQHAGEMDLNLISSALHPRSPTVVVTDGAHSVRALSDSHHNFTSSVPPIDQVASTTGAGDAFNAGYLNAWLTGSDIPGSLTAGTSLAARVLGQVGATTLDRE